MKLLVTGQHFPWWYCPLRWPRRSSARTNRPPSPYRIWGCLVSHFSLSQIHSVKEFAEIAATMSSEKISQQSVFDKTWWNLTPISLSLLVYALTFREMYVAHCFLLPPCEAAAASASASAAKRSTSMYGLRFNGSLCMISLVEQWTVYAVRLGG